MKFPKIHVLLSTYNGEKYLIEQLDSIFKQTYQNFVLFIRDDGSSDSTRELIDSYIVAHPGYNERIVMLSNPSAVNMGYMGSFWNLMQQCGGADYYAFCDQDDVWLPNKLQNSIDYLNEEDDSQPLLYFSGFYYCNDDLTSKTPAHAMSLPITLQNVLFYTPAFGFSIVINECLRKMAIQITDYENLPHDGWTQKLAAALGKIIYDPSCTAYYRRHNTAVTAGNRNKTALLLNWISNDILGNAMKETHYVLMRFYQEYGSIMSEENAALLRLFAIEKASFSVWWKRLTYRGHLRPTLGGRLALKICFLLNTF